MLLRTVAGINSGAAIDQLAQLVYVRRTLQRRVQTNLAFVIERRQRLVERLHPVLVLARLHHRVDLVDFVFADQVANSAVGHEDLEGHRAAAAFSTRQERLTQNSFEHERKLCANLSLLIGREDVDDTVDGGSR